MSLVAKRSHDRHDDRHDADHEGGLRAARAQSAGDRPGLGVQALRLQWRAAPTRTAHAAVACKRSPAHSCMMMSETPLPTLALGRSAKRAPCTELSSSAKRTTSSTSPPPRGNARVIGGGTCRRPGARRPRHRRRARSARPRPGCRRRPGAQRAHAIGAERVARGGDGSQRLCRPAHRRAAPCAERRARSARRRSGLPQASGARSAHATGAERVARGGASWHAGAASNAGRLLPC